MRRVVALVAAAALAFARSSAIGAAAGPPVGLDRFDLGSQLMLRLFGETSDSTASFAAAYGDRASESPLRDLALQVVPAGAKAPYLPSGVAAAFAEDRFALRDLSSDQTAASAPAARFDLGPSVVHFSAPSPAQDDLAIEPPGPRFTAAYQPVPPEPAISPEPGTLAFAPPDVQPIDTLSSTTKIGAVYFEENAEGVSTQTPQLALPDASYSADANFDVRAGRGVNLNLSSAYEHVAENDAEAFPVAPVGSASSWQLPGAGAALTVPNYADLSRLSLGAGVSVPVVHGLTLNLNYDAQRLYGAYGLPGLVNLDAVNDTYGGKLTFNIPQISSALSIGAYQDRYQDNLLQMNGSTATREDVNFTVKF